ncbi:MAG: chorismate synthase [Deltaproteobacteria bacterium]|nr:chorismate synthase [Deltaproteobacteria bacterium]
MAGDSFGVQLRLTTFGESHGPEVGCVVQGVPAGVALDVAHIASWLARRRPGQNALQSQRKEPDVPRIVSGVYQGRALGTPIAVVVDNGDARSKDYAALGDEFRPGHADWTWHLRYGHRDPRGGGRASARETVARVIGGAIAEAVVQALCRSQSLPVPVTVAWAQQVASVQANGPPPHRLTGEAQTGFSFDPATLERCHVDMSPVRCPDAEASAAMVAAIESARRDRDSLGGVVRCVVRDPPAGLGDPVFDKLPASIGHALLSLPACRGVQFGSGFAAAGLSGSVHNDAFVPGRVPLRTATNHHGGTLGGISTGMPLVVDAAFKPPATIPRGQLVASPDGAARELAVTGRHDPCVVPRAVPIVEAAVLFCLADALLGATGARVR